MSHLGKYLVGASESSGPTPLLRDLGGASTDVAGRPMSPKIKGFHCPANAGLPEAA